MKLLRWLGCFSAAAVGIPIAAMFLTLLASVLVHLLLDISYATHSVFALSRFVLLFCGGVGMFLAILKFTIYLERELK